MSSDYWWIICHLSDEEELGFLPFYTTALKDVFLPDSAEEILYKWQENPDIFFNPKDTDRNILLYNRFIYAFIINSFQSLGESIISEEGKAGFKLNENNCFEFITIKRCTPGAILWYALGSELAK